MDRCLRDTGHLAQLGVKAGPEPETLLLDKVKALPSELTNHYRIILDRKGERALNSMFF